MPTVPINGVMWVGTLPEFRGLGFAQNLMRLADERARATGHPLQALTTGMPQFYRPLGWGVCGRQTYAQALSRNLPQVSDGVIEGRAGFWHVRPWRQVELSDLMSLYEKQYAQVTGSVIRSEEYWRWLIGRRYAHVIWVACQGEAVRGYAFVKDHKILEIASDPAHPQALEALLGRVRAEALERAYPQVMVHAPSNHPVIEAFLSASGRLIDQDIDRRHRPRCTTSRTSGRFLKCILPELSRRAVAAGCRPAPRAGHHHRRPPLADPHRGEELAGRARQAQPPAPDPRPPTLVRLLMGHTGVDSTTGEEGFVGLDRDRHRRRSHPLPRPADLAQSARRGHGLIGVGPIT